MKNHHLVALLLAGSVGLAASAIAVATAAPAPAAPAAPAGGGLTILDFKPAFDDLMTMLVQPRHTKLWLAAQQKNWQLAGFELNEMGGALRRCRADRSEISQYQRGRDGLFDLHAQDPGRGWSHHGSEYRAVQHRLCRADKCLQSLPRGIGAPVPGDQGSGRVGGCSISGSGFPAPRRSQIGRQ